MVAEACEQLIAYRVPTEDQGGVKYNPTQRGAPDHAALSSGHGPIDDSGNKGVLNDLWSECWQEGSNSRGRAEERNQRVERDDCLDEATVSLVNINIHTITSTCTSYARERTLSHSIYGHNIHHRI